jgi:ribosomal protein S8
VLPNLPTDFIETDAMGEQRSAILGTYSPFFVRNIKRSRTRKKGEDVAAITLRRSPIKQIKRETSYIALEMRKLITHKISTLWEEGYIMDITITKADLNQYVVALYHKKTIRNIKVHLKKYHKDEKRLMSISNSNVKDGSVGVDKDVYSATSKGKSLKQTKIH